MTNSLPKPRPARRAALAALAVLGTAALLASPAAIPSAAAEEGSAPPACVQYFSDWRYTTVANDCDTAVAVTVDYTDGQSAPCRVVDPGTWATFAGYGPQLNYVTGLRTCDPGPAPTGGV